MKIKYALFTLAMIATVINLCASYPGGWGRGGGLVLEKNGQKTVKSVAQSSKKTFAQQTSTKKQSNKK